MIKAYTLQKWDDRAIANINQMFQEIYTELGLANPQAVTKKNASLLLPSLFEETYLEAGIPMPLRLKKVGEKEIPAINTLFEYLCLEI